MSTLPQFARFWMVARKPTGPHSRTEPKARYSAIEDARTAARDLAQANNAAFVVLEAVEIFKPGDTGETGRLL